jgi:integrase
MPQVKNATPSRKTVQFPVLVERGPTGLKGRVKIYSTPVVVDGESYDSFTVVHYDLGKRSRQRFNDYAKAHSFAEEKAVQLSGGEMAAVSLKNEDQRIYGAAVEALKPLDISLDFAVREYLAARKLLGDVSVLDAAKFYERHGKSVTQKASLEEIRQAMIDGLKSDGRSAYHVRDVRRHVGAFIAKHPRQDIQEVTTAQINEWLRSLEVKGRTRDNYRDSLHNFFSFARTEGYLPKDRPTAAEETKRINEATAENVVFTVKEMRGMLKGAPDWLIPTLALKFFSGLRTEEMIRLKWEDIKFDQNVIFLNKQVTKTKQRRIVPMLPNLKEWLTPHLQAEGQIAARWGSSHTLSKAWSTHAENVGVAYKKNGMRNSYISYRVASIKNVAQVSLESGNSPGVIQRDYLELVTEEDAEKWFATVPNMPVSK